MAEERKIDEEDLQRRYMELQIITKQIKQGQGQIEALDEQLESLAGIMNSLDDLSGSKKGAEMLSPIGEGIFVKSTLDDNHELLVNVGSNVVVPKTIEGAKEMLKKKIEQGQHHRMQMIEELQGMIEQAKASEREFASMVE